VVAALALVVVAAGCAREPGAVALTAEWPERAPSYVEAHRRWTRHADAERNLTTTLDVYATLKSAEWRAAWVEQVARTMKMSDAAKQQLAAAERAAAQEKWEVELIVATTYHTWQDFARGEKSMWRVALVGDGGREVLPTAIREDPRPRAELEVFWPEMNGFHRAYVVTFPRNGADGQPLVGEGGEGLILKVAGAQGGVELRWRGR
jgi:hypothetical protein